MPSPRTEHVHFRPYWFHLWTWFVYFWRRALEMNTSRKVARPPVLGQQRSPSPAHPTTHPPRQEHKTGPSGPGLFWGSFRAHSGSPGCHYPAFEYNHPTPQPHTQVNMFAKCLVFLKRPILELLRDGYSCALQNKGNDPSGHSLRGSRWQHEMSKWIGQAHHRKTGVNTQGCGFR